MLFRKLAVTHAHAPVPTRLDTMQHPRTGGPIETQSSTDQAAGRQHRQLGNNNNYGGYLVGSNGYSYTPYSLSWRYLGMFVDPNCNTNYYYGGRRRLWGYNSGYCRKVLWAAYHDPDYGGQGIAEYSFLQRSTGSWDSSTCNAPRGSSGKKTRCRRLDCHEAGTKLELVGVFKETDGLYDFTEQLFKHSGYCLWDEDKNYDGTYGEASDYEFMTNLSENWVEECTYLEYVQDASGNSLYYDTKPLPGGDITYGVYTDSSCTEESSLTWSDVLEEYNVDDYEAGMPSMESMDRWNALLSDYKICQPCRAYNRIQDWSGNNYWEGLNDATWQDYEGDDGDGGYDRWGFNCYDDAGYQSCNQCYKFQTQTDMTPASSSDLELATKQGTILGIKVDGIHYGGGYYGVPGPGVRVAKATLRVSLSTMALVLVFYYFYGRKLRWDHKNDDGFEYSRYHDGRRSGSRTRSRSGTRSRSRVRSKNNNDSKDNWLVYIQTAHNKVCSDASLLVRQIERRARAVKRVPERRGDYSVPLKSGRGRQKHRGDDRHSTRVASRGSSRGSSGGSSRGRRRQDIRHGHRSMHRAASEGKYRQGARDSNMARARSASQGRLRQESSAREMLKISRGISVNRGAMKTAEAQGRQYQRWTKSGELMGSCLVCDLYCPEITQLKDCPRYVWEPSARFRIYSDVSSES